MRQFLSVVFALSLLGILFAQGREELSNFEKARLYYNQIEDQFDKYKVPLLKKEPIPKSLKTVSYTLDVQKYFNPKLPTKTCVGVLLEELPQCQQERKEETLRKAQITESRVKNQTLCTDMEELAFLDFEAWWNPEIDPYTKCSEERNPELLLTQKQESKSKSLQALQKISLPMDIFAGANSPHLEKHEALLEEIQEISEQLLVEMGNFAVYSQEFPHDEFVLYLNPPSWEGNPNEKQLGDFLRKHLALLKAHRNSLLVSQILWKTPTTKNLTESNQTILRDLERQSLFLQSISFLSNREKDHLKKAVNCIEILSKKHPNANLGFYSGFFLKYSVPFVPVDEKRLQYEKYEPIAKQLVIANQKYLYESDLFSQRLQFLLSSCDVAISLPSLDLPLLDKPTKEKD